MTDGAVRVEKLQRKGTKVVSAHLLNHLIIIRTDFGRKIWQWKSTAYKVLRCSYKSEVQPVIFIHPLIPSDTPVLELHPDYQGSWPLRNGVHNR